MNNKVDYCIELTGSEYALVGARPSTCKGVSWLVKGFCLVSSTTGHPYYSGCIAVPGKKMVCGRGRGRGE